MPGFLLGVQPIVFGSQLVGSAKQSLLQMPQLCGLVVSQLPPAPLLLLLEPPPPPQLRRQPASAAAECRGRRRRPELATSLVVAPASGAQSAKQNASVEQPEAPTAPRSAAARAAQPRLFGPRGSSRHLLRRCRLGDDASDAQPPRRPPRRGPSARSSSTSFAPEASHAQPPPPVARPQMPGGSSPLLFVEPPPAPELLVLPLELAVLVEPPPCPLPPCRRRPVRWSGTRRSCTSRPSGRATPAHGSLPHAPVAGSQNEPSAVQGFGLHLSAHAGGRHLRRDRRPCPLPQAGLAVGHALAVDAGLLAAHFTSAQGLTHSNPVKVAFGLHSSPALQLFALHGSSMQEPRLQTLPQPRQGLLKQVSFAHLPALGPYLGAHRARRRRSRRSRDPGSRSGPCTRRPGRRPQFADQGAGRGRRSPCRCRP